MTSGSAPVVPVLRDGSSSGSSSGSSPVLKEGGLEKRSASLLQLWRRKRCVLTADCLSLYADAQGSRAKELKLQSIRKLDCVERAGRFVYFTIVTTDDREIDFRCHGDEQSSWNAVITLALIDFQNRQAIRDFKREHREQDREESREEHRERAASKSSASPGRRERREARAS